MVTIQNMPEEIKNFVREHGLMSTEDFAHEPSAGVQLALTSVAELAMRCFRELAGQASGREVLWNAARESGEPDSPAPTRNGALAPPSQQGAGLIKNVLDDRYHGTVNTIASAANIQTASVSRMIDVVAGAALEIMGGLVAKHHWSMQELGEWLNPRATAAPPVAVPLATAAPVPMAPRPVAPAAGGAATWFANRSGTLLALVSLVAVVEFGYILSTRSNAENTVAVDSNMADSAAGNGQYTAIPVTNISAPAERPKTAVPVVLKLNNGLRQIIGANSTESKLYQFLIDPDKEVDLVDPTKGWIGFDRIYFETNKATLTNESLWQLSNVASILKRFPEAKLKIGGYTDVSGSPIVNLRLSKLRAEAAMASLVSLGVPATRLTAAGYGALDNIATNDTEEGRALNRRVSLQVTQK